MSNFIESEFERLGWKYNITYMCPGTILISYPKSGRTWLRMMLAKLITLKGYNHEKYEIFPALHDTFKKIKTKFPQDEHKQLNVIFLHRNPGDVAVSYFNEISTSSRSSWCYRGSMSRFIRGIDTPDGKEIGLMPIIQFNNKWIQKRDKFANFLELSYYMLHKNPAKCIRQICDVVNLDVTDEQIQEAVEYASFKNMKKIDYGVGTNYLAKYKGNFGKDEPGRVNLGKYNNFGSFLSPEDMKIYKLFMKESLITYEYDEEK